SLGIAVYFAPNTLQGFLDAITTAVNDVVNRPSVISISWGLSEDSWMQPSLDAFDQAFQDAGHLGRISSSVPAFDGHILAFCAAGFVQAPQKCRHEVRGCIGRLAAQESDYWHRLLRSRRERPRHRRAAERR